MKKVLALGLALALAASLGVTALAEEGIVPISGDIAMPIADDTAVALPDEVPVEIATEPVNEGGTELVVFPDPANDPENAPEVVDVPLSSHYAATIVMDGESVDTSKVPDAPAGYLPMRLLCEVSGGSASWYPEDNQSLFFFDENSIVVDFGKETVEVGFQVVEGAKPYLDPAGFTFLPYSVLNALETVTVDPNLELDVDRYDITTSASDPTVKLAKSILEAVESAARMKQTPAEMEEYLGIRQENFTDIVGYFPMMINADTVVVGQVAEGKLDAAKEDLEARKQTTIQNFEHYLQGPYEMAKEGQVVVAPDGEHIMLIISGDNAKAIELFNEAYPAK